MSLYGMNRDAGTVREFEKEKKQTFTVVTARVVKRYNPRVLLSMLIQTAVRLELVGVQSVPVGDCR